MLARPSQQFAVIRSVGGVEDDADVHHDVDEATFRRYERSQVLSILIEAKTHGPAGLDHAALDRFIAGLVEPPLPGRPEDEPKVVNTRVVLALFNEEE